MGKKIIGYTTGVFDLFHVGHLNILREAKKQCDFLIVGVSTDEVVLNNKNKLPVIPFNERVEIVEAIKYVDKVIPQTSYDVDFKVKSCVENDVDILFVGSDWQGTEKWKNIEAQLAKHGCKVVYIRHTDGISSSLLRDKIVIKK